jgi:hypothetical protein
MKYYCKNCGTELRIGKGIDTSDLFEDGMQCPFDYMHGEMKLIPNYETPEQHEKRTGNPWPDNGLVWFRLYAYYRLEGGEGWDKWKVQLYGEIKNVFKDRTLQIVIADPPVPPPYDWRPE